MTRFAKYLMAAGLGVVFVAQCGCGARQQPQPQPQPQRPRVVIKQTVFSDHPPEYWLRELQSSKHSDRLRAIEMLRDYKVQRGMNLVPQLVNIMEETESGMVRKDAATAIGKMEDFSADAIPALCAQLKNTEWDERDMVCEALARMKLKPEIVIPALTEALKSDDARLREKAAMAIGRFRDPRGVAPLTEALSDPEPLVQAQAASALQNIGAAAKPALPALKKLQGSKDHNAADAAKWAVSAIENGF